MHLKKWIGMIAVLLTFSLPAQSLFHVQYDWDSVPAAFPPDSLRKSKAVIVKDFRCVEYYQESNNSISRYKTYHSIIWMNDHSAVDRFNKLFIPIRPGNKLLYVKARTIGPDGHFTQYNDGALQHLSNVKGYGNYDVFAIEGAELGGMVEYIYTVREDNSYFGRELFQTDIPVMNAELQIVYPYYLRFIEKSYNGFPSASVEEGHDGKRYLRCLQNYIPAAYEEEYSSYTNSLQRAEYKLSVNESVGEFELFDFDRAGQQYYDYLHVEDPKAQRAIKVLLGEWKIAGIVGVEDRIKAINSNILQGFTLVDGQSGDLDDLAKVSENKFGNALGLQRLYVALLEAAGIDFQIAFTTNRFEYQFDPSFESWLQLDGCLLYFPASGKYIEPNNLLSVYGPPSYELAGNDALFFYKKNGELQTEVRHINLPADSFDQTNMEFDVQLVNGWQKSVVKMELETSGYDGINNRFIYSYSDPLKKDEFIRSEVLNTGSDVQIDTIKVENTELQNSFDNKPFRIKAYTYQAGLLEFAQNNLLFSIGELIGEQNELYLKNNRRTDVEFRYPLQYNRSIVFHIPNGYQVTNPEILNMKVEMPDQTAYFHSTVSMNEADHSLRVDIHEVYSKAHYPVYQFNDFRRVINAAADFNKLVLVLSKM